jgi:hypothetical protein
MKNFINPLDENFSYGYNNDLYNLRSAESIFQCHYKKAIYLPVSFREECVRVCNKISHYADSQVRVPIILFSGGLDSEIVIRAFIDSEKPFRIVVNRFLNDFNSHEIFYVEKFLKSHNLTAEYIDIDVESWLESDEALRMAEISKCPYSEMLPTMKLIDYVYTQLNGIPVLGNGDFYASIIEGKWMYVEFEYILSWMRYCVEKNIIGAINFFQQTPEIVLAMGRDPLISKTIQDGFKPNLRSTKYMIYQKYWNDVEIRQKFNGAEKIQTLCDKINNTHLIKYSDYKSKWTMPLDEFLSIMMPTDATKAE